MHKDACRIRHLGTGLIHRLSLILDLGKGQHLVLEVSGWLGRESSATLLPHSVGNAVHTQVRQHQISALFPCARKEEQRAGGA